ncbi:MAG: LarC family nickel insertion protein, partial [Clostridiales bacterium]|nr:LarC family nickel insertion protein [Clostridiales bacterium]
MCKRSQRSKYRQRIWRRLPCQYDQPHWRNDLVKLLYLECNMGAAGDMLMSALYELCHDKEAFINIMNGLLPNVSVTAGKETKCGITGSRVSVIVSGKEEASEDVDPKDMRDLSEESGHNQNSVHSHGHYHSSYQGNDDVIHSRDHVHGQNHNHDHVLHTHNDVNGAVHTHDHHTHDHQPHDTVHHEHSSFEEVCDLIGGLRLPGKVKADAIAVYRLLAEAEAHAHGSPVDHVHFHEVGTLDAIADIVGVCLLIYLLAPDRIMASPIHVGSGNVRCSHGILPVPAPATAHILRGVPIYSGSIR